jgi:predicted ATPase
VVLALPGAHRWRRAQHRPDLLRGAFKPPARRLIKPQHTLGGISRWACGTKPCRLSLPLSAFPRFDHNHVPCSGFALGNAVGADEPWRDHDFIDKVIALQRQRQNSVAAARDSSTVLFDRSPGCTLALSRYLGYSTSPLLAEEVSRVVAERTYEPTVFFIRNQGFVTATAARRISFEESLVFEQVQEQTYRDLGFEVVDVPAAPLADRVALILQAIGHSPG